MLQQLLQASLPKSITLKDAIRHMQRILYHWTVSEIYSATILPKKARYQFNVVFSYPLNIYLPSHFNDV